MKLKNLLLICAVLLFAFPALAQDDNGKVEVSGEFSYVRWNPSKNYANHVNLFGGGGSISYFFTQYIGVKGEFTGYGSQNTSFVIPGGEGNQIFTASGNLFTYMFGPVVKKRSGTLQPYGHVLLGGAHTNVYTNLNTEIGNISPTSNAFAMAVGGGLDIKITPSIAFRLGEVDYMLTHFNAYSPVNGVQNNNQNNFRFQSGIVFSF